MTARCRRVGTRPGRIKATLAHAPWTVFTDPEVARVGLTEREACARYGRGAHVHRLPLIRVDRAQAESDRRGFVKLVYRSNGTTSVPTSLQRESAR